MTSPLLEKLTPLLESLRNQMDLPRPATNAIFEEIYTILSEAEELSKFQQNLVDELKSQIVCLNSDWRGR